MNSSLFLLIVGLIGFLEMRAEETVHSDLFLTVPMNWPKNVIHRTSFCSFEGPL